MYACVCRHACTHMYMHINGNGQFGGCSLPLFLTQDLLLNLKLAPLVALAGQPAAGMYQSPLSRIGVAVHASIHACSRIILEQQALYLLNYLSSLVFVFQKVDEHYLIHVFECSVYMYVCAPRVCMVLAEVRRGL